MRRVEIVRHPTPSERAALIGFVNSIATELGERPLSDHLWLDLNAGGGDGFVSVTVADASAVIAMAQISSANAGSVLELVASPTVDLAVLTDVFETALDAFAASGGGLLGWWVEGGDDHAQSLAAEHGLELDRTLYEMRRSLPHPDRSTIVTRDFDPTRDIDGWLAVNNSAFADHAEQGGWTRATLELRMAEPWFTPARLRIHEIDGVVAAFCWTKVHDGAQPIGEIYVIAVDPAFHGKGLGRQVTLAGLDSLTGEGLETVQLYVDAANASAVAMYERLGFAIHRTRHAFAGTLAPSIRA